VLVLGGNLQLVDGNRSVPQQVGDPELRGHRQRTRLLISPRHGEQLDEVLRR
jgi:hypothetical protein